MPSQTALPRYSTAVAWSEQIPGVFTIGYSTIGGSDVLGQPYPQFTFDQPYDDLSANVLSFEYTRGHSDDLTEVVAQSGRIEIQDDAEVYNPHNIDSPLRGKLNPLRPFRIQSVGPRLVPMISNGRIIDDVVRARVVLGENFERALLRRKPLVYWRFNEAAGVLDYADAGGDADVLAYPEGVAPTDAATFISGDEGKAKTLADGSRFIVQNCDSVNPRAGVSVFALFSLTPITPPLPDRYILHKYGQWSLRVDTGGHLSFSYTGTDDTTVVDVRSVPALIQGTPYLTVCSWDGKTVRMWFNRSEVEVERGLLG